MVKLFAKTELMVQSSTIEPYILFSSLTNLKSKHFGSVETTEPTEAGR